MPDRERNFSSIEQEPTHEQHGVPQELINQLWLATHADLGRGVSNPLPAVFLALAAHERGISSTDIVLSGGRWGSHRLHTAQGDVDIVCEWPDENSGSDGVVRLLIDSTQQAGGISERANFWNDKYTFQADPTFVAQKMAQLQAEQEVADRREAERYAKRQAALQQTVTILRDRLGDKLTIAADPALTDCLTTLLDDDAADLNKFAVSVRPVSWEDIANNEWLITIWETTPQGLAIYNQLEYIQ